MDFASGSLRLTTIRFLLCAFALLLLSLPVQSVYAQQQQPPSAAQPQPAVPQQPAAPAPQASPAPANGAAEQQPAPPSAAPAAPAAPVEPAAPPAPVLSEAQQQEIATTQKEAADLKEDMDRLEKAVQRNIENEQGLQRLRSDIIDVFLRSRAFRDALQPRADALRQQIDKLGPIPEKGAAPESADVADERARLSAVAAEIDGAVKSMELLSVRLRQLRDNVQEARQNIFASQLLKRSASPLAPTTWLTIANDAPAAWRQISDTFANWFNLIGQKTSQFWGLMAGILVLFFVLRTIARRLIGLKLDGEREEPPTFFVQAATVGWTAPLFALPAFAALQALSWGLSSLNLLTYDFGKIAEVAFPAITILIGVSALTQAILEPDRVAWRLVNLSTPAAYRVATIIKRIAAVYSIDLVLQEFSRRLYLPLSISVIEMVLASIAIGLLLLQLFYTRFEPKAVTTGLHRDTAEANISGVPKRVSLLRPILIKVPSLLLGIAIVGLSLVGYIGLGRFITTQLLVTSSAIAVVLIIHLAIRAMLGAPETGVKPLATRLHENIGLDPKQGAIVSQALSLLLNVSLAVIAFPLILITWGYTPQEALMFMRSLFFGFQVGDFRISLARILVAVGLFLLLVFATRIAQRWIDKSVSKSQRFDPGVANSVHTAIGYTGFIIAGLAAVAYSGIDITNFAIVAGALSVGIGFGLQSIINNFVSGLILLVERPIKVGDRVTVNGEVGFVRRISVRSTEIETFDRSSLIVPNSEFITTTVTNWTHRNALGRALIRVGVSYNSDPERVRDILLKVADESPLIQKHPAPWVGFDDFGADSLNFILIGVISDINKIGDASSDLRYRIFKAFKAEGIEIPYPQRDIHLRDLDGVKTVLTRLAEERARQQAEARVGDSKPSTET